MTYLTKLKGVSAPAGAPQLMVPADEEIALFAMGELVDWRRPAAGVLPGNGWPGQGGDNVISPLLGDVGDYTYEPSGLNGRPYYSTDVVNILSTPVENTLWPSGSYTMVWVGSPNSAQVSSQSIFCTLPQSPTFSRVGHSNDGLYIQVAHNGQATDVYTFPEVPGDHCIMVSYDANDGSIEAFVDTLFVGESSLPLSADSRDLSFFGTITRGVSGGTSASFRGRIYDLMVFDTPLHKNPGRRLIVDRYLRSRYGAS